MPTSFFSANLWRNSLIVSLLVNLAAIILLSRLLSPSAPPPTPPQLEINLISLSHAQTADLPFIAAPTTQTIATPVPIAASEDSSNNPPADPASTTAAAIPAAQSTGNVANSGNANDSPVSATPSPGNDNVQTVANAPVVIHRVNPSYPRAARRAGHQGTVVLRVHITADGIVDDVEIKSSSGFSELDDAAVSTISQWQFQPATNSNGTPIACWSSVPLSFNLN